MRHEPHVPEERSEKKIDAAEVRFTTFLRFYIQRSNRQRRSDSTLTGIVCLNGLRQTQHTWERRRPPPRLRVVQLRTTHASRHVAGARPQTALQVNVVDERRLVPVAEADAAHSRSSTEPGEVRVAVEERPPLAAVREQRGRELTVKLGA